MASALGWFGSNVWTLALIIIKSATTAGLSARVIKLVDMSKGNVKSNGNRRVLFIAKRIAQNRER